MFYRIIFLSLALYINGVRPDQSYIDNAASKLTDCMERNLIDPTRTYFPELNLPHESLQAYKIAAATNPEFLFNPIHNILFCELFGYDPNLVANPYQTAYNWKRCDELTDFEISNLKGSVHMCNKAVMLAKTRINDFASWEAENDQYKASIKNEEAEIISLRSQISEKDREIEQKEEELENARQGHVIGFLGSWFTGAGALAVTFLSGGTAAPVTGPLFLGAWGTGMANGVAAIARDIFSSIHNLKQEKTELEAQITAKQSSIETYKKYIAANNQKQKSKAHDNTNILVQEYDRSLKTQEQLTNYVFNQIRDELYSKYNELIPHWEKTDKVLSNFANTFIQSMREKNNILEDSSCCEKIFRAFGFTTSYEPDKKFYIELNQEQRKGYIRQAERSLQQAIQDGKDRAADVRNMLKQQEKLLGQVSYNQADLDSWSNSGLGALIKGLMPVVKIIIIYSFNPAASAVIQMIGNGLFNNELARQISSFLLNTVFDKLAGI